MTEKHTSDNPAELSPSEARGAKPVKGMPVVLGVSIAVIIGIFAVILISFM